MKYSDSQRMKRIRMMTGKLLDYLRDENITAEIVMDREPVRWTVTTPLYNIGEHVYYLSNEYKDAHPGIPWNKISGLRHRLVHDYDNTNWSIICSILFDILPDFYRQLQMLDIQANGREGDTP